MKEKIKQIILAYMHFGLLSMNEKMADELKNNLKKEIDMKEICHFFYYLGAADGVVSSIAGKKPDFEKQYKEFEHELKNE